LGPNYQARRKAWSKCGRNCRSLELARAAFAEKPAGRFVIRSRTRVVKRHPEGDW
jgi:hypothetical protein